MVLKYPTSSMEQVTMMMRTYLVWPGFLMVALFLAHFDGAFGCSGRQVITNSTEGILTDGDSDYPPNAHCEWLIVAPHPKQYITLDFTKMDTECTYDFLFVFDGRSYSSHLLGSFSGITVPDTLSAKSGYMLIYFYSDRNYVLSGFDAMYKITNCPLDCNGKGTCKDHVCHCNSGYYGESCELEMNPNNCGDGNWDIINKKCICVTGYAGMDCKIALNASDNVNSWNIVAHSESGFSARVGHAGAFLKASESLWIFGGHNLNGFLNDLLRFSFLQNRWNTVPKSTPWPRGCYGHTVTAVGPDLFMLGGMLEDNTHTNELWHYNVSTMSWSRKANTSNFQPPGLVYHTTTLVEGRWLYVFGGRHENGSFSSNMYRIAVPEAIKWEVVPVKGGKDTVRRLIGHSTVYHPESKSLLVFGGLKPEYARFSERSNFLHAFNVDKNYWSQIHFNQDSDVMTPPKPRAFHSANIMGNYMVVYGGNSHKHSEDEICYDNGLYLYHLGCHIWVDLRELQKNFSVNVPMPPSGRFSHVAAVAYDNTLLIAGGYRGNVLGDLRAYIVPPPLAKHESEAIVARLTDHCSQYTHNDFCIADPECGWCKQMKVSLVAGCLHRSNGRLCKDNLKTKKCPGICGTLASCQACTVMGKKALPTDTTLTRLQQNENCAWCVKEARCQKLDVPTGTCSPTHGTISGIAGWWGKNSTRITKLSACRTDDYPAGLHWIKYKNPQNYSYPDEVTLVRNSDKEYQFKHVVKKELSIGGKNLAMFKGFIHPLDAPSSTGGDLIVSLVVMASEGKLYMSKDGSPKGKEEVAKLQSQSFGTTNARRHQGGPIFPNKTRGHKYYTELESWREVPRYDNEQIKSTMSLKWTGALSDTSHTDQAITAEFLEPFNSGSCKNYSNCMACMTDTSCGWCPSSAACLNKMSTDLPASSCGSSNPDTYLITLSDDCPVCNDFVSCDVCAKNPLCEWLVEDSRCMRRGRFPGVAVLAPEMCPLSCVLRSNCSSCMSTPECAWCEKTKTCFAFSQYITRHVYGQCAEWVDSMSAKQCTECSQHKKCKTCLDDFQCGWCGNTYNPTIGRCMDGDFVGPNDSSNCSALISDVHNVTAPSDWSYGICPDVEECLLGLDNCHQNATCNNTFDSYTCKCNRGFMGNGRDVCNKTCFFNCKHGHCSGPPDYVCQCNIGWTGDECESNCGCNNHSTCLSGRGTCDKCQHWTVGSHCETCRPGSYGNATTSLGCTKCNCNSHGIDSLGVCNITSGVCFCQDNTEGTNCERCKTGFYGEPRNGGKCYLKCEGRNLIVNATSSALGTYAGKGMSNKSHVFCLWIITVYPDLNSTGSVLNTPIITFTMEKTINLECSKDFVYVYDGIPALASGRAENKPNLLGAFCGRGLANPVSVEAKTGYMTVYFEADLTQMPDAATGGFNAIYTVHGCPSSCFDNRVCQGGHCTCRTGFRGVACDQELCPLNCSYNKGLGYCDSVKGLCVCHTGYGGAGCNETISNVGVFNLLTDPSRLDPKSSIALPPARMGHSFVSCDGESFYLFGGYSVTHGLLNDMWEYNKAANSWTEVVPHSTNNPKPRYFHAATCVNLIKYMYMFGGHMENMTDYLDNRVNHMWKYSPEHKKWTAIKTPTTVLPRAGHTMTLIDDTNLIIFGGFTTFDYFSDKIYKYDTSKSTGEWKELTTNGAVPTGVYGHTSVYQKKSNTIYVYGGYYYHIEKTIASNFLYALDFNDMTWSRLQAFGSTVPRPRFFHAAFTTNDYMVILGGRLGTESFTSDVMAYNYKCNRWIDLKRSGNNTSYKVYGDGPPAMIGQAIKATPTEIYIFGGYNGISHGSLIKLKMPSDLCEMILDLDVCLSTFGCTACGKVDDAGNNQTFCYSNSKQSQARPCADDPKAEFFPIKVENVCNVQSLEKRDCNIHKNCTDCLAIWPAFRNARRVCKWCSNCPVGKCVPSESNCSQLNPCKREQRNMTSAGTCWAQMCQAADCDKCGAKRCMWSRQFKRAGEVSRSVHAAPTFDWNCVTENLRQISQEKIKTIESMPPDPCPKRCYRYTNWSTCLASFGSEGGFQKCVWSKTLAECMSPAYLPIHCTNGRCGHLVFHFKSYPIRCSGYKQCSDCLDAAGCGWCAFGGRNGVGLCMEGGLYQPIYGSCKTGDVQLGNEPLTELLSHLLVEARNVPITWAFAQCPPENECQNDHHTCDDNEDCVDIPAGFNCTCKTGYKRDEISQKCLPVCDQGCGEHGTCLQPNKCHCHFGYVGPDCSTECHCNGHSSCLSIQQKDICLQCMNNTQGKRCSECKPLFVGDPRDGGKCTPCFTYCNEHTAVCMEDKEYDVIVKLMGLITMPVQVANISKLLLRGPQDKAVCYNCGNNTRGDKCGACKQGYFRLTTETTFLPTLACRKCECNGHGEICDQKDGKHCDCKNNTETHCKDDNGPCWQSQCSDCKEYFLGRPTSGHQCYRQMTVEIDYCFNPKTQTECQNPSPLPYGHSVFYAVQPKYLNVDIRITIDVSKGGVDVFFSPYDDTFIVNTDPMTFTHLVTLDPRYRTVMAERDANGNLRTKRSTGTNGTKAVHVMDTQNAKELNTFITIMEKDTFLVVRDVRFRLVITLPLEIHNLKESRFYIVLISKMDSENNGTFGNMYFRQDQPRIDLFVFFSVFFSCFFLFLAVCVLLWKIKQGVDERRNRQRRAIEMEHMASRPFGKVTVLIDRDTPYQQILPPVRKNRLPKLTGRSSSQDNRDNHAASDPYNVAPIAHEPTDDGIAAIGTVMFQLPGGCSAPVRAALGSGLITMRVLYPNMNQPKTQIRRRTCSVNT